MEPNHPEVAAAVKAQLAAAAAPAEPPSNPCPDKGKYEHSKVICYVITEHRSRRMRRSFQQKDVVAVRFQK